MAEDAIEGLPEGGMPLVIPAEPDTVPMGLPLETPTVETGEVTEFDEATGLPLIAMDKSPQVFPGDNEEDGEAGAILDFLF